MIQKQSYKNDAWTSYVDREEELPHSPWAHHSLSQHFYMLTNWETLHLFLLDFYRGFIISAGSITSLATSDRTQSPAPLPTPQVEEVGWEVGLKIAI